MARELFELSLLGGAYERRYRRLRPDIEKLPWGSLALDGLDPALLEAGRRFWTLAAFQEHRTGAAIAATLEALLAARAPIDLVAVASRFVLDEMAHVELCARVAGELGGAVALTYDPATLFVRPSPSLPPLVAACELVLRVFCIGEAFSVPMQRLTAAAATQPLFRDVIARIARDEAAHGAFGWSFFDWAGELLDEAARQHLRGVAASAIAQFEQGLQSAAPPANELSLGWLRRDRYVAAARTVLDEEVSGPLRARRLLD
jgi:hypothetical protein